PPSTCDCWSRPPRRACRTASNLPGVATSTDRHPSRRRSGATPTRSRPPRWAGRCASSCRGRRPSSGARTVGRRLRSRRLATRAWGSGSRNCPCTTSDRRRPCTGSCATRTGGRRRATGRSPWSPPRAAERAWRPRPRRDEASARTGSPLHLLERGWGRGASVLLVVEVEPEVVGGVLVVLAVQLSAVGAAVELAHESFLPHRVVDDSRLLQQDLLLEPPDHLLPAAPLARQLLVEDDQAVGVGVAPDHGELCESLLLPP